MAAAEEQQASGTGESTPSISRCHQVLQKHLWSSQVYRAIISLILTHPNAQVVLLTREKMIMIMKVTDFRWKENLPGATEPNHTLPITHFGD